MIGSLSFDLIQKGMYGPLIRGGELHIFPPGPYDPAAIAQSIEDNQITIINCSPATFYPVVDAAAANGFKQLMSLQRITVGGEALSLARMKPWLANENCHTDIANHYGPTECSDISAAYLLTRANMNNYDYVPIGRPIYNAQLTIVNEDLQLCPIGVAGELLIGGDGVGAGYLNNPGMTAAKFIANPFPETYGSRVYRTGDLCRYLPDGNIQFLGRMDHQVKIRGCRIELSEIESALVKHDAIREVSVIVRNPDPGATAEPAIVAYFAPKNGVTPEASELRRFLREKLPEYMVPSAFVALEKFPLSPNGKVDRRALPVPAQQRADAGPQHTAPRNAIEKTLGEIWSSVLHLDQVGVNDNFFDLGGHSLLMVQLHARICEALKTDLSIIKLFQYPNIRALADFLGQSSAASPTLQKARDLASRQRHALNRLRPAERVQTP
jgi:acyl-coenzyme A synthetase/AMP-(fatty) acid ligase/acyl carrier protein